MITTGVVAREVAMVNLQATTTAVAQAQDHPILPLTTTREETMVVHLRQEMGALQDMAAVIIMAEQEMTLGNHTMGAFRDKEAAPAMTTAIEETATRAEHQADMTDQEMTGLTAAQWASMTRLR